MCSSDLSRQQRDSGGGDSGRDRGNDSNAPNNETEPLVPGFGVDEALPLPLGFGGAAAVSAAVKIESDDTREAEERMRRYDSNQDGILDKNEIANGRWSDDPLTYDRNRDGKLTVSELAVRYARRRTDEQQQNNSSSGSRGSSSNSSSSRSGSSTNVDPRMEEIGRAHV